MSPSIDHLAVAATSLDGRELDDFLGVTLPPGGRHARMGTHNRLLRIGTGAYLELIAIDPKSAPPGHPRWFELDEPSMQVRLAGGPRLVHWVARVDTTELPVLPIRRRTLGAVPARRPLLAADGPPRWHASGRWRGPEPHLLVRDPRTPRRACQTSG